MKEQYDILTITIMGVMLFTLLSSFIVFFVARYRQKQKQFEQEKALIQSEKEKEVAKAQLEISEEILKKMSLEIHDNIGQSLSVAKLTLQAMNQSNLNSQSEQLSNILTKTITDLRNLSKTLNGNYVIEHGLTDAIRREIEIINGTGKINCTFIGDSSDKALSDNYEVILFRCIQEAMNNAIKHSEASEISVEVTDNKKDLVVKIRDNGKGISPEAVESIGMISMRERAAMMDGSLELESKPGDGTALIFRIPCNTNQTKNHYEG